MVAYPSQATEDVHPQRHVNNDVITPQSDDAVSRRADNLFKNKDGQFAIIDWQLYQSGAGGTEFEQTVGVNGAPQETHAAMQEVFEVYHRTLVEHGPAGIGETYTLQMIRDDYHIACWYVSLVVAHNSFRLTSCLLPGCFGLRSRER